MKARLYKYCFLLCVFCSLTSIAMAQDAVVYDKHVEARTLGGGFHSIKVSGSVDVYLTAAQVQVIAVSNYGEGSEILTSVSDSVLTIKSTKNGGWRNNKKPAKVYVAYTDLKYISGYGASDIYLIDTLKATSLTISLYNACDFKGTVMLQELDLDISNASDITLSGRADKVIIKSSGASDVQAFGLTALYCSAQQRGASDIRIYVTKEVYLQSSGSSDFQLKGGATITKK